LQKRGLPRVCGQTSQKYSVIGERKYVLSLHFAERVFFDYSDANIEV
jgi:hypothetical protein